MHNRATTVLMAGAIAVAAAGGGVALGSTTHPPVKACEKKSNHALGLLKNGKCATGFAKVSLGAQGPRGEAGPGAISETLTNPNDDIQRSFTKVIDGVEIASSCGVGSGVDISLLPKTGTLDASGTGSQDTTLFPIDFAGVTSVGVGGTTNADINVIVDDNGGPFTRLDVHGEHDPGECHLWAVVIPATEATG